MPSVCLVDATCWAPVCELVNPMFSALLTAGAALPPEVGAPDACGVVVPPHAAATRPTIAIATMRVGLMAAISFACSIRAHSPTGSECAIQQAKAAHYSPGEVTRRGLESASGSSDGSAAGARIGRSRR